MTTDQPFQLRIQLLGGFSIQLGDRTLQADQFRLRKSRNLVKLLALAPNHRLHRDQLVEQLWPDLGPEAAVNNFHQALYAARRLFESVLNISDVLQFKDEILHLSLMMPLWIDAEAFEEHASQARRSQNPSSFQAALNLYTGELLPEDLYEDWAAARREALLREHLSLLLEQAALYETHQDLHAAITAYQYVLSRDPGCEEAHAGLMRLYARSGQRSAALAQYETCRHFLQNELGVELSAEMIELYKHIRAGEFTGHAGTHPLPVIPEHASAVQGLPTWLFPFVERRGLIEQILERLNDPHCRLITLVGPGGSGKTRLAVEAVSGPLASFPDGVCFVSLAAVHSGEAIVPAIALAMNFRFQGSEDPALQLIHFLRSREQLLVLDNFEHLISHARFVGEILLAAPQVKMLVTSRVGLNLMGEVLLPIPGMQIPQQAPEGLAEAFQYNSLKLFIEGARRVVPGFSPAAAELSQIVRICHLVGGLPLAILLAAAWIRLLTTEQIVAEIAARSLDFLEGEWQDAPQRQRSLRLIFDHSWNWLLERERQIFAGLSIFRGSFTYPAAQQVAGASLRDLMKFVNHSLLDHTPAGRYELHEVLRQYAEERLKENPEGNQAVNERYIHYYTAALQNWGTALKSSYQLETLAEMDFEIANIRLAWCWAVEQGQIALLDQGQTGLGIYYRKRNLFSEGAVMFRQAAECLAAEEFSQLPHLVGCRAGLLAWTGLCEMWSGQMNSSKVSLDQSLELLEKASLAGQDIRQYRAFSLMLAGGYPSFGKIADFKEILSESLKLYRELNDRWGEANVLYLQGGRNQWFGDHTESIRCHQESLAIRRELKILMEVVDSMLALSLALTLVGQFVKAEDLVQEADALCRSMGNPAVLAEVLHALAMIQLSKGMYVEMFAPLVESAAICEKLGNYYLLSRVYMRMGQMNAGLGRYDQARIYFEKNFSLFQEKDQMQMIGSSNFRLGELALAQGHWSEADRILRSGIATLREYGARSLYGIPIAELGIAALRLGDHDQACQCLVEALGIAAQVRNLETPIYILPGVILFVADAGQIERAVELYALAIRYPMVANSVLYQDLVGKSIVALARTLPPAVITAAQERGRARDLWETMDELLADPLFLS